MKLKQVVIGQGITHISYLWQYLSAYYPEKENIADLISDVKTALKQANETGKCVYINQDGLGELRCSPTGYLTLMLPIQTYQVWNEELEVKNV